MIYFLGVLHGVCLRLVEDVSEPLVEVSFT